MARRGNKRPPLSPEKRSGIMRAIRSRNTRPEKIVRSLLHSLGYRFRIHAKGLPGTPDIAFAARRKAVFVHGCFWHQHSTAACSAGRLPRSNVEYWTPKLARNVARDCHNEAQLRGAGWNVLIIWECKVTDAATTRSRLVSFLGPPRLPS